MPITRIAASLRDVGTHTSREGRARIVDAVVEVGDGDIGAFWNLGQFSDASHIVAGQDNGRGSPAGIATFWKNLRSLSWPNAIFDPSNPDRKTVNRFLNGGSSFDLEWFESSPFYELLWRPAGIGDQLRMYAYQGSRFLGALITTRGRKTEHFTRRDEARVRPLIPALVSALLSAEHRDGAAPGDLVVRPNGTVEFASEEASAWLMRPGFKEALKAAVKSLERGQPCPPCHTLRDANASWSRLHGEGAHRYLFHVTPAPSVMLSCTAILSPTQRKVAKALAAGGAIAEVALDLGVSAETVRTHTKEIYRRLNVSSRMELATLIR